MVFFAENGIANEPNVGKQSSKELNYYNHIKPVEQNVWELYTPLEQ